MNNNLQSPASVHSKKRISGGKGALLKVWSSKKRLSSSSASKKRYSKEANVNLSTESPPFSPNPEDISRSGSISMASSSKHALPFHEVTVINEDSSVNIPASPSLRDNDYDDSSPSTPSLLLQRTQNEARGYQLQLEASQAKVERLVIDLKRSKAQILDLIQQNQFMLKQLKAMDERQAKDGSLAETNAQLKQENLMIKLAITASIIFILCGGRAYIIAIASVVYMMIDVMA